MKGLEKLTCIRLAEVLSQRNAVTTDAITEALYTQDKTGEAFVDLLIQSGSITEWDLAKVVVEHFQLPFMMASNYEVPDAAKTRLPEDIWFRHLLVPLDVFDDFVTVVMPILTPYEVLEKLQAAHKIEICPYVGLPSENRKVLGELFAGFGDWCKREQGEREKRAQAKTPGKKGVAGDWMDIFDSADAAVRDGLGPKKR